MMFMCVALTRGRVITSSLPMATPMEQRVIPLTEVTPSLRLSRKIYRKNRNPDSNTKTEIREKMWPRLPSEGREGGESEVL
jgi:hypothetical protein